MADNKNNELFDKYHFGFHNYEDEDYEDEDELSYIEMECPNCGANLKFNSKTHTK